jgi:hypothetical protein
MAKKKGPCKVTIKGKGDTKPREMTFEEYIAMLHDGGFEDLVKQGAIDPESLKGDNPFEPGAQQEQEAQGPPMPPDIPQSPEDKEQSNSEETSKRKLIQRATEDRDALRAKVEAYGLDRNVENRNDAWDLAKAFIDDVGFEEAEYAAATVLTGAAKTFVYAQLIDTLETGMANAKTAEEIDNILRKQAELLDIWDAQIADSAREIGALSKVYREALFTYKADIKIKEYKKASGGYISPEVEAKFRAYEQQIKDLNQKIKEAEQRATAEKEGEIMANIVTDVTSEKKKAKTSYSEQAKRMADKFRKLKGKPVQFKDANGNPIDIQRMGLSFDDIIELGAKAIEATGKIADGIAAVMEKLGEQDWFNSLSDRDQEAVRAQVEGLLSDTTGGAIKIPKGMIRVLVEMGNDNIDSLTDAVMDQLKEEYPDATRRDFRDAITGYGKEAGKTRDQVSREIEVMKRIGQKMSQIEDLKMGIIAEPDPVKKAQKQKQEKDLDSEIRDLFRDLGITEAKKIEQAKKNAQRRIEELQKRIDEGNYAPAKRERQYTPDAELETLLDEKKALQDQLKELQDQTGFTEAKKLDQAKKALEKRIKQLEEKIAKGDFTKQQKQPAYTADDEIRDLRAKRQELQDEIDLEIFKEELRQRGWKGTFEDYAKDIWNLTRNAKASLDLSFVFVQGKLISGGILHPVTALRSGLQAWKQFWSEGKARQWNTFIRSHEKYDEMKLVGVSLTEYDAKVEAQEEMMLTGPILNGLWAAVVSPSRFFGKEAFEIAKKLNPFNAFSRAQVAYLNTFRILRYDELSEKLKKKEGKNLQTDLQSFKNAADVVNTFSGRSGLGKIDQNPLLRKALPQAFFSPRNWASILKTSSPIALFWAYKLRDKGSSKKPGNMFSVAQKAALWDFMGAMGSTGAIVAMAAMRLNDDDDDDAEVVLDPLSSYFLQIRLGNTYVDPWAGRMQTIVFTTRFIVDAMTRGGTTSNLGTDNKPARDVLMWEYMSRKFHPTLSLLFNYWGTSQEEGKPRLTRYGEEYLLKDELQEAFTPMVYSMLTELHEEQPGHIEGFLGPLGYLGVGVQTYVPKRRDVNRYKNEETKEFMKTYKPSGVSMIKSEEFVNVLDKEQMLELNTLYQNKAEILLDQYAKTVPAEIEDVRVSPERRRITYMERQDAIAELRAKNLPETEDNIKQTAMEMERKSKIAFKIDGFAETARNAAIEEYMMSKGKEVPKPYIGAIRKYERRLKYYTDKAAE